jgi:superfamily I DNA/RNA helicase
MTPLEIALALKWGELAGRLVLGMDDDQAINRWRGGDPAPLLALHGDGVVDHVLDRSYRVPESVRAVAERWVRRLTSRREKVYHSRLDEAGNMVVGKAHHVRETVRSIELINKIVADVDAGHTVMVIASCNYMLAPLIENMRAVGLPFHNPYRPTEQRWNPLGSAVREGAMATSERVRRFLALAERNWTGADVAAWAELVKLSDAGMVRGAKTIIARFDHDKEVPFEEVAALFRDDDFGREALALATEPNVAFLEHALLKAKIEPAAYPLQIARHHGAAALDVAPQVVVGTIHSVKGAAADVVYVCPDVSPAAANRMAHRDGQAEAIRLFYVAMTRAYRELRVLAPATRLYPKDLVPSDLEVIEG